MKARTFSSPNHRFQVTLEADQVGRMLEFCCAAGNRETGGILVGYYTDARDRAVVTEVSGPPADSRASRSRFERGVLGLSHWLQTLWDGPRHYYLGEWHFHPDNSPAPSGKDTDQMRNVALSPSYHCPEPILIILGGDPKGAWELSAHVFLRHGGIIALADVTTIGEGTDAL